MSRGEICYGHDDMPGTPDYGDFSNNYDVDNCVYTYTSYGYSYDYKYDIFQCVEDTESNSLQFS